MSIIGLLSCLSAAGLLYLAGVSCAGLRNVTVVDGVAALHPSQLVLSKHSQRGKE